ncbi:MAG: hypothetical protein P0120_16855 [Nitrospira sp.]|nr:hypothetical protein [Nitrospira sp.]
MKVSSSNYALYGDMSRRVMSTLSDLIDAVTTISEKIFRPGHAYQKCGVMLTDLVPAVRERHDLFDERDRQRQSRLMKRLMQLIQTMVRA